MVEESREKQKTEDKIPGGSYIWAQTALDGRSYGSIPGKLFSGFRQVVRGRRGKNPDGKDRLWIYGSYSSLATQFGMTDKEVRGAVAKLIEKKAIISAKNPGSNDRRRYALVDEEEALAALAPGWARLMREESAAPEGSSLGNLLPQRAAVCCPRGRHTEGTDTEEEPEATHRFAVASGSSEISIMRTRLVSYLNRAFTRCDQFRRIEEISEKERAGVEPMLERQLRLNPDESSFLDWLTIYLKDTNYFRALPVCAILSKTDWSPEARLRIRSIVGPALMLSLHNKPMTKCKVLRGYDLDLNDFLEPNYTFLLNPHQLSMHYDKMQAQVVGDEITLNKFKWCNTHYEEEEINDRLPDSLIFENWGFICGL